MSLLVAWGDKTGEGWQTISAREVVGKIVTAGESFLMGACQVTVAKATKGVMRTETRGRSGNQALR